jgi:hypothetical protein
MPPVSEKQRRLFRAAAANPALRKQKGISLSVARDFNESDPGGKLPTKVKKKRSKPTETPYYSMPKRKL